jgi:hypothetical protein
MEPLYRKLIAQTGVRLRLLSVLALVLMAPATRSSAELVINEIMFHPLETWPPAQPYRNTNRTEYIEIYNAGTTTAALVNYRLEGGISFGFLPGMSLSPDDYLVICERLEVFTNAYPLVGNVVGDFGGQLNNGGERITLSRSDDGNWLTEDTIEYVDDEGADGTGRSLELVHPGFSRLPDQFYGDWYTSITVSGTPGVVNSVFDPTPPPVLGDVNHDPPIPLPEGVVTITARITGRDGNDVNTANLMYRKDALTSNAWMNSQMVDDGTKGDVFASDGIYTAVVPSVDDPPFLQNQVMEFRIDISDTYGSRLYPATNRAGVYHGPWSYFCKFAEDLETDTAYRGEYRTFHLLITEVDRQAIRNDIQANPGGGGECTVLVDATLVTSEGDIFYNSSLRCRGGSSKDVNLGGYRVEVPNGMVLDGRRRHNLNYNQSIDQFIGMTIFGWTTPGFDLDVDLVRVWVNHLYKSPPQAIYLLLEPFNDEAIRARYPPGDLGNRYSADGDHRTGYLNYQGENVATYMGPSGYFINENNPYTAWHEIIDFSRILNQSETTYPTALTNRMHVRQWARHFATQICVDNMEAGFGSPYSSYGDELRLYVDPVDQQFDIFPWDMDEIIGSGAKIWDYGPGAAGPLVAKFLYNDPVLPYYAGDVYDIITTVMSQANMTDLYNSMGSKMNPFKTSYLNINNAQRNGLLSKIATDFTIDGHTPGSPFLWTDPVLQPNVVTAPAVNQQVSPAQWVYLGANDFPGFGQDFVRLTTIRSGRGTFSITDAIMFSNDVATIVVDNDDPGVETNEFWDTVVPSGGYLNSSYLKTPNTNATATYTPVLPTQGVFDVYAWLFNAPSADAAHYDIRAIHVFHNLPTAGKAPHTYTARVEVEGNEAQWESLPVANWSLAQAISVTSLVQSVAFETFDSEGNLLDSRHLTAISESFANVITNDITSDTSWTSRKRTVVIDDNISVATGARLSVGPGVMVLIEPGRTFTINGTLEFLGNAQNPAYVLPRSQGSDWVIQLSGGNASMTASNAHFGGGRIAVSGGGALKLYDSVVKHSQHADGIVSATGGANVHLRRSIVRDFAKTRFDSSPTLIEECLFENMSTSGIEFVGSASTSAVRRTTVRSPIGFSTRGVLFDSTSVGLADNCLFESIPGSGIEVNNATASIKYSLFDGCSTGLLTTGASAVENVNNTITKSLVGINGDQSITNAIVWSVVTSAVGGPATVAYGDVQLPGTNLYAGTANINRNPWFRDEAASDYRLQLISPARGGGLGSENMGASFPVGANPATPTGLSLSADTNAIHLSWQDTSGDEETAFEIERSLDGTNWVNVAEVGANVTNYWDLGLTQNTEFHYRVRAVHNRGSSFYSDSANRITGIEDETQVLIDNLRITEFMYNLPGPDDGEFMEFKNISQSETLDLSGLMTDAAPGNTINRFVFPNGTMLSPQSFFVLVRDPVAFSTVHPGVPIDGVYQCDIGCGLDNAGETLWIQDSASNDIVRFRYEGGENDPNWYPTTDGNGHSMVPVDPNPFTGDPNLPVFWRANSNVGGSPGADDPNPGFGTVVINELLAHQDVPSGDVVELYNAGSSAVDLGGWFLSDDENSLRKYSFPPGTIIGASNYLLRTENSHFGIVPAGTNGFAFSELGDEAILSSGSGGSLTSYRTIEKFGATANNVTLGRHTRSDGEVDFVAMSGQTPLARNALPRVGPVVINEIMYNPAAGGKEYIELLNISPFPVPLYDIVHPTNTWQFDGAMEYTFPTGVTMAAGEHLLIVSVQPDEFRQLFGLSNSPIRVFGPFSGNLNNAGESVKFYYPGQPEPGGFVPRIRTDRVRYDDDPPWPTSADNGGPSLERKVAIDYGNDPANWVAASMGGTPGMHNNTIGLPSVGFPDISAASLESNQTLTITVSLLPQVTSTVMVQYAISGGTATRNSDYRFEDDTLIFWPYDTNQTFSLTILDDATPSGEPNETIAISITGVSANAVIGGNAVYTHTIIDNDATSLAAPTITPSVDMMFTNAIIVSIAPTVANSDIYYTIDGSRPTRDDILYQNPFILATSARVTARTFLGSANDGCSTNVLLTELPVAFTTGPPGLPATIASLATISASECEIVWIGDPADSYTVYRWTNLLASPAEILTNGLQGDPTGTNVYTDLNSTPPAFYLIGTEQP